jgi:transcriptional regulator with XRE-family HTH domain
MTLGERIKAVRELRGWNQQELSRRAHVRQALISELESGKKADTTGSVLARLARTLGVSIDYLVGLYNHDPNRSPAEGYAVESLTPLLVTTLPQEEYGCEEYTKT